MTNVRRFDFKKTYEEVDIAGEVFQIEFNDQKLEEYMKKIDFFRQESVRINQIDTSKLSSEEQVEVFNDMQDVTKDMIETFLGENTYTPIYEKAGNSLMNMLDLAIYLADVVDARTKKEQADRKKKYVNKSKKAHANVLADPFA